jgi:gamma-glutamyl:cysteine ligase YbdK (ATP-grasp superfamily)
MQMQAELEVSRGCCTGLLQVAKEMEATEAKVRAVASAHGITICLG